MMQEPGSKGWVIVDLDGTVCDIAHRVHHAQNRDWEAFHSALPLDQPFPHMAQLIHCLYSCNVSMLVITGRPETYRAKTLAWLQQHSLASRFDEIVRQPEKDGPPDTALKLRLLDEFFGNREEALRRVLFALDDRDRVVEAYRNAGFKCFQVAEGKY